MNLEVANRLLKYRKKSGYSQEDLASKIGVSRQAVSKWERSEASPDTDNLMLLADQIFHPIYPQISSNNYTSYIASRSKKYRKIQ